MALNELTERPSTVFVLETVDLPPGETASSSWMIAAFNRNAALLDDIITGAIVPGLEVFVNGAVFDAATMILTLQDNDPGSPDVVQSIAHSIGNHTDVDISTDAPVSGDRFVFDGTNFVPFKTSVFSMGMTAQNVNGSGAAAGNTVSMGSAGTVTAIGAAVVPAAGGIPFPLAGTYRVRMQISYDTTTTRYSPMLRLTVDGTAQEAEGSMGYVRNGTGDNRGGCVVEEDLTVTAGQVLGANVFRESGGGGAVTLRSPGSRVSWEKIA